jgi:hypothetical protein
MTITLNLYDEGAEDNAGPIAAEYVAADAADAIDFLSSALSRADNGRATGEVRTFVVGIVLKD